MKHSRRQAPPHHRITKRGGVCSRGGRCAALCPLNGIEHQGRQSTTSYITTRTITRRRVLPALASEWVHSIDPWDQRSPGSRNGLNRQRRREEQRAAKRRVGGGGLTLGGRPYRGSIVIVIDAARSTEGNRERKGTVVFAGRRLLILFFEFIPELPRRPTPLLL